MLYPELVNLTGHDIMLIEERRRHKVESSGSLRVDSLMEEVGMIGVGSLQIPLLRITEQRLPPVRRQEDRLYIVSGIVQARARHRDDFVSPSRVVRDRNGEIVGCKALAIIQRGNGHDS